LKKLTLPPTFINFHKRWLRGLKRKLTKFSEKKQLKAKPRGRPFPPGVSGNPRGRPLGSLNKTTLAVLEGSKRAEEKMAKPLMLDKTRHYECWSDCYIQDGMKFNKTTLQRVNPKGPTPLRPVRLSVREIRQNVIWKGRKCLSQFGWLFDPGTHLPVD
jgi:hypothetical protein